MNRRIGLAALAAAMVLGACSHNPTGPVAGTLSIQLQSPNSGLDAAILFTLTGPDPITNVRAVPGDTLWSTDFSSTTSKILLTGTIASGVILRFDVPDVNRMAEYLVTVDQVAGASDYSLRGTGGYVGFPAK